MERQSDTQEQLPPELSIVIPVYNERRTLGQLLALVAASLPSVRKELVIVDDCSTDGTREWLRQKFGSGARVAGGIALGEDGEIELPEVPAGGVPLQISVHYHLENQGKGGALKTGFAQVTGNVVVVQDADLEYDPEDWGRMYPLIAHRNVADVVYGSRFFGSPHRSLNYHHYLANRLISVIFNVLYNQTLSDVEVCYKMMRREVLQSMQLGARDFGIEIEMSARIARNRRWRIYEVGIAYYGRSYAEGKKINWKDGVKALYYLVKYRIT